MGAWRIDGWPCPSIDVLSASKREIVTEFLEQQDTTYHHNNNINNITAESQQMERSRGQTHECHHRHAQRGRGGRRQLYTNSTNKYQDVRGSNWCFLLGENSWRPFSQELRWQCSFLPSNEAPKAILTKPSRDSNGRHDHQVLLWWGVRE